MKRVFRIGLSLFGLLLLAVPAMAVERVSYVVLPFAVQGPQGFSYLERSIPQMLTSRLYAKGQVEPAVADLPANQKPVTDETAAEKARVAYKADYVLWGTVTVMGEDCSLDVRIRNKAGKTWTKSREAKTNQMIAAIKHLSDAINQEVFGRSAQAGATAPRPAAAPERINQMNPEITINETSPKDVYLNPQFRYAGSSQDDSRLRSQAMPFVTVGMEVVDADGDGKKEILLLSDNVLRAYRFSKDRLEPVAEYNLPRSADSLSIRSLPRREGTPWIIVNAIDSQNVPQSRILTLQGKTFKEEMTNIRFLLNVAKIPPDYLPVLVGQKTRPPRLFDTGVYELNKSGNTLVEGRRLDLPTAANVFNFTYLPGSAKEGDKLVLLSGKNENLVTYTAKGARLAESQESYSGSAKGIEIDPTMPGMGKEKTTIGGTFYIPLRMVPIDLERDHTYELLVNRPISTASQIFERYRSFPQSELHSLFWDGVGMNLQWKTRRIKGAVADFALADGNNDGVMDLVVCINTHPGALGASARKTIVMLYPLDLAKTNPNTPSENPNLDE